MARDDHAVVWHAGDHLIDRYLPDRGLAVHVVAAASASGRVHGYDITTLCGEKATGTHTRALPTAPVTCNVCLTKSIKYPEF